MLLYEFISLAEIFSCRIYKHIICTYFREYYIKEEFDVNLETTIQLLNNKDYPTLSEKLKTAQEADIADILDKLEEKRALIVFRLLPKEIAADVFSYLSTEKQAEISQLINEKELSDILADLYLMYLLVICHRSLQNNFAKNYCRNAFVLSYYAVN